MLEKTKIKREHNTKKEKALKEVFPHLWNLYEHLFNTRKGMEDRLSYLLAINTLFILVYIELFKVQMSEFILYSIPFVLLLASSIILFIQFFQKRVLVPWFEYNQVTQFIDNNEFYTKSLEEIFACAAGTYEYILDRRKILRLCYTILFFALLSTIILVLLGFNFEQSRITSAVGVGAIGIVVYWWVMKNSEKAYAANYHAQSDTIREYFEKWLQN